MFVVRMLRTAQQGTKSASDDDCVTPEEPCTGLPQFTDCQASSNAVRGVSFCTEWPRTTVPTYAVHLALILYARCTYVCTCDGPRSVFQTALCMPSKCPWVCAPHGPMHVWRLALACILSSRRYVLQICGCTGLPRSLPQPIPGVSTMEAASQDPGLARRRHLLAVRRQDSKRGWVPVHTQIDLPWRCFGRLLCRLSKCAKNQGTASVPMHTPF